MTVSTFIFALLIVSTFTGLFTQALKNLLDSLNKKYNSNILAGIVSIIIAALITVGYIIIYSVPVTAIVIVYAIGLMLLSWLCAMVGYDKVKQALSQLGKL